MGCSLGHGLESSGNPGTTETSHHVYYILNSLKGILQGSIVGLFRGILGVKTKAHVVNNLNHKMCAQALGKQVISGQNGRLLHYC